MLWMLWMLLPTASAGGFGPVHMVLDVDWDQGLVAFKDIVHDEPFDSEWIDCGYGGMETRPTSGVTLGLANTKTGDVQRWHIYQQATAKSGCTPEPEQKKRLADAKKAFAAAGLDIDAKRTDSAKTPDTKGVTTVGGHTLTVEKTDPSPDLVAEADRKEMRTASVALKLDGTRIRTHSEWWSRYTNTYGFQGRVEGAWPQEDGDGLLIRYAMVGSSMRGEFTRSYWAMVQADSPEALPAHLPPNALDSGKVVAVNLLGATDRYAAVKLVATDDSPRDEPCDYAGMPTGQGVLLGLWDLDDERLVRGWPVYDWNTERDCTDRATSERELAEAKKRFANLGIDIATPLTAIPVKDGKATVGGMEWTAREGVVVLGDGPVFEAPTHDPDELVFTTAWSVPSGAVFAYGRPWKSGKIDLKLTPALPR